MNKQITDYLDENLFEDYILQILYYNRIDKNEGIDLVKSTTAKNA